MFNLLSTPPKTSCESAAIAGQLASMPSSETSDLFLLLFDLLAALQEELVSYESLLTFQPQSPTGVIRFSGVAAVLFFISLASRWHSQSVHLHVNR